MTFQAFSLELHLCTTCFSLYEKLHPESRSCSSNMDVAFVGLGVSGAVPSVPCRRAPPAPRQGSHAGRAAQAAAAAMAGVAVAVRSSRRVPRCKVKATEVEMPLESLVEVHGEYVKNLTPERLEGLRRLFPEVDVETEGLRLVHEDGEGGFGSRWMCFWCPIHYFRTLISTSEFDWWLLQSWHPIQPMHETLPMQQEPSSHFHLVSSGSFCSHDVLPNPINEKRCKNWWHIEIPG